MVRLPGVVVAAARPAVREFVRTIFLLMPAVFAAKSPGSKLAAMVSAPARLLTRTASVGLAYSSDSICQSASGCGPGWISAISGSTPSAPGRRTCVGFSARRAALSFCLAIRACSRCRFVIVGRERCAMGAVLEVGHVRTRPALSYQRDCLRPTESEKLPQSRRRCLEKAGRNSRSAER